MIAGNRLAATPTPGMRDANPVHRPTPPPAPGGGGGDLKLHPGMGRRSPG